MLLRQVGKIMDRRSSGDFLGNLPHDRRGNRLRHERQRGRADRACEGVLRPGACDERESLCLLRVRDP